jgi:hypothetical protein
VFTFNRNRKTTYLGEQFRSRKLIVHYRSLVATFYGNEKVSDTNLEKTVMAILRKNPGHM